MESPNPLDQSIIRNTDTKENVQANFELHVQQGGKLIADRKFGEAIRHFRNKAAAQDAGFVMGNAREILLDNVDPHRIQDLSNLIAANSWFMNGKEIIVSGAVIVGKRISDMSDGEMSNAEKSLAHEIALIHMEEHLHGLQHLRGGPLVGYEDKEVDVASYMQKNNIPLTDAFLRRYDRVLFLSNKDTADDSLSKRPAIRRGVFVNVQRSDGSIESDWQVIGFSTQTGEAIVRNYANGLEKHLPQSELAKLNENGVYPFERSKDFVDLFKVIDRLKQIHGFLEVYNAQQIKNLISRVSRNQETIDKIPRSGGLRLKVAELLGIRDSTIVSRPTIRLA